MARAPNWRGARQGRCANLNHPLHDPCDAINGITRRDQVLIFRLQTGHNRLKAHLFSKFKIGSTPLC
ncbi:unnamed protein product [Nezara viridula]|uniref:Uncharacterized protein n=1 Tax=Nezara viridula TaxID=85310 RepID=A0A9P0H6X7_NEZVI|nr:unnamed protein product [Nezara viridula]